MTSQRGRRLVAALFVVVSALGGCGPSWHPVTLPQAKPFDRGTVLEFHMRDTTVRLHAVRLDRDTISGVPWLQHTNCDSCRVHFALADISEARVGDPGAGAWYLMVPILLVISFWFSLRNIPNT